MLKGAAILAVGFGLGFAKCMSEQPEIVGAAVAFKKFLEEDQEGRIHASKGVEVPGIYYLVERLENALGQKAGTPDDEPVLTDEAGEPLLTMGDLRAPFSVGPYDKIPTTEADLGDIEVAKEPWTEGETP